MKSLLTIAALLCYTVLFAQAGALDSTFANGGKFLYKDIDLQKYIYDINAVAIQPNGKIIIAGYGNNYLSGNADFAVIRLSKNGALDSAFGNNGEVFIDFSTQNFTSYDVAYGLAVQPDGKIIVVGDANDDYIIPKTNINNRYDIAVARLTQNGSLDSTFDKDGKKLIDLSPYVKILYSSVDYCRAVALRPNGKIVLAGYTYNYNSAFAASKDAVAVQLNRDGSADKQFGINGIDVINIGSTDEDIAGLVLQQDDKIVLGGTSSSGLSHFLAIRLKAAGSIDSSFSQDGFAVIDGKSGYEIGTSIAMQADGKILLGGDQNRYYDDAKLEVARIDTNGNPDKSFNGSGVQVVAADYFDYVTGMALSVQQDGKIVQTGNYFKSTGGVYISYSGHQNFQVLRYNTNGSLDSSFGTFGKAIIDFGNWTDNRADYNTACAIQKDGKIVVAGYSENEAGHPAVARLIPTGLNIALTGPSDQFADVPAGQCTATFNNIDPVLYPDTAFSMVKYQLYSTGTTVPYDSGYGTLSGRPMDIGATTAIYSLINNPLQRAVFNIDAEGGTTAGALDFDGIDDRVDLAYIDPVGAGEDGQYSFEAWIKVKAYNKKENSVIFGNERNNNGGIVVALDTKGYISTYQPAAGTITSSYKVPIDTWTHIAFVQTSRKLDLYVNGNFVQTLLTAPYLHRAVNSSFYLGAYTKDSSTFSRHFNGVMDEIRIWSKAICQSQIQNNLYCSDLEYQNGLYAHYTLNVGLASCKNTADTILDGYRNGILRNFALNGPTSNWVAGYITGTCKEFISLTLNTPGSIYTPVEPGKCGARVKFKATASSGCSDTITIRYSQNPGSFFPVGNTEVMVEAKDAFGNTASGQFTITVVDTIPPYMMTRNASVMLNANGDAYIIPALVLDTVYDNCELNSYNGLTVSPASFKCYNAGDNVVVVTAVDKSGNHTTKTTHVTVLPYAGYSSVTAVPVTQQYSDLVTLNAGLSYAANFYYNGCSPASDVTFKMGSKVLGKSGLTPKSYDLTGTLNYPLLNTTSNVVTATFGGVNNSAYTFVNPAATTLFTLPENAIVKYTGPQAIQSVTDKLTLPVSALITDTADGYRGDIRNAAVTFTIKPVTAGASIVGASAITVGALDSLSADKTSGTARTSFTVSAGGNANAQFIVTVMAGNYYTGNLSVPVSITKSGSLTTSGEKFKPLKNNEIFNVLIYPNPSEHFYNIEAQSSNTFEKITVRITDITGKIMDIIPDISPNQSIMLGAKYAAGTYIAEISQGQNKKFFKLIKL